MKYACVHERLLCLINIHAVTESQKEIILGWKFNYYDRNDDGELQLVEEFTFHSNLLALSGCNEYFDHLSELMDTNGNEAITLQEWNDFFDRNSSGIYQYSANLYCY